jgi:hypothetical protein
MGCTDVARVVLLDSGPLNLLTMRPGSAAIGDRCRAWMLRLGATGWHFIIPGIADYEVRRELVRKGATARTALLDDLRATTAFLPVDQDVLDRAADFWAAARKAGLPTASPDALDADVVLAAQAEFAASLGHTVTIATTNVGHLTRFADARLWETIT